ncbi:sirohydrochlorin chelatase [Aquabacterium sp. J223]|uniref:sirohydrochlorin chelatase n=1 Tax=Aquabacterium sp. J223 TaxID=2898431 RepID=UPI0021AD59ED|nr:CbiX/SirB N-terminal domain-containing protein [Aquabacterium sp. J223]UUX94821.1 CbiX/SirB N-terminal domain-containing protein [Aquabacterium sp. J223]
MTPTPQGLLLFAHGARDPAWALPFQAVAAQVATRRPDLSLRLAFLEFMAPDLLAAGDELAAEGCAEVTVLPLFLGAGGHVRKDLPRLLDTLRQRHPGVRFSLQPAVGEMPAVIDAMAAAAVTALPPSP